MALLIQAWIHPTPVHAQHNIDKAADAIGQLRSIGIVVSTGDSREARIAGLSLRPGQLYQAIAYCRSIPNLTSVHIESCAISGEELGEFRTLIGVRDLFLAKLSLSRKALDNFCSASDLRRLSIFDCDLEESGVAHLMSLKRIEYLDLRSCSGFKADHYHFLEKMTRLKHLAVMNQPCSDVDIARIRGWTDIRTLWLTGTDVTDGVLESARTLYELKELEIDRTRFTKHALEQFEEQRPDVFVVTRPQRAD